MKYLKMFIASLRMAKTLDSNHFAHDSKRGAAMIDALCPEVAAGRSAAADSYAHTGTGTAPKPA
ncbi:MAG: hypothetical protein OEN55_13320 [Alphaproteobacteria bacterium]|nr:hypothetical protein [Alphaproteobacteria bacterium]